MVNGFYAIYYTGVSGSGIGVLAINNGIIAGADMVGGRYDGTYKQSAIAGFYGTRRFELPSRPEVRL